MTNYIVTTNKGKYELTNSRVHELKGKLKELRLNHEVVTNLIIQIKPGV